jgi:hypothetical protein
MKRATIGAARAHTSHLVLGASSSPFNNWNGSPAGKNATDCI